jgi:hypothetical protein
MQAFKFIHETSVLNYRASTSVFRMIVHQNKITNNVEYGVYVPRMRLGAKSLSENQTTWTKYML